MSINCGQRPEGVETFVPPEERAMSGLDWAVIIGLNGSIVAYGFYLSRGVTDSTDWFLAGRRLPWWLVGLSI